MATCGFCAGPDKTSSEHIFSQWISKLFAPHWESTRTDSNEQVQQWTSGDIDAKARVVCKKCNEGWMSTLENKLFKPAMTPFIIGETGMPVGLETARSIALFTFKTALILDLSRRAENTFFSRSIRQNFMNNLSIPSHVNIWVCPYVLEGKIRADYMVGNYQHNPSLGNPGQMYVVTLAIGYFCVQLVGVKQIWKSPIVAAPGFERIAMPLWPMLPNGITWPPIDRAIMSVDSFKRFHRRWAE